MGRGLVHVGGEEVPAHDPKKTPGLASTYLLDATPGRHTQGGELLEPVELELDGLEDRVVRLTTHSSRMADAAVTRDHGILQVSGLAYSFRENLEGPGAVVEEVLL